MQLLERESQLAALQSYVQEAEAGDGRLVLVAGEAGVGKSSLLEALARRVEGPRVLWSACDGLFTPRPLGPVHDLATQVGGALAELCRNEAPREQLFSAVLEAISSPGEGVLLVVEDVHWADGATLDLVRFLARRIRDVAALVAVSYRDDALSADHPLRIVLGELASHRTVRRVDLPPLTHAAVARLAAGTPWSVDEVHRVTGGNPFFVTEMLRSDAGTLPRSAHDAVCARLAALSAAARTAAEVAALAGQRVDAELVSEAAGSTTRDLDDLLAHGLLAEDTEGLRFRHEIVRMVVESQLVGHRRAVHHRRLLMALLARGSDDAARLAYHAEGCGDRDIVLREAPRAARRAARLSAHREALAQFERALRHAPGEAGSTRAALLDDIATELALMDRPAEASAARTAAIELWRDLGDERRQGASLARHQRELVAVGQPELAGRAGRQALELLEPLGASPELAWAYAGAAGVAMLAGRHEEALAAADQAVSIGEAHGLADVLSDALNTQACSRACLGSEWRAPMERALALALEQHRGPLAARAYNNKLGLLVGELDLAEAEDCYAAALAHARMSDIATYRRCMEGDWALALVRLGRWDESLALAQKLLAPASSSLSNRLMPLAARLLIGIRRGEDGLEAAFDEVRSIASALSEPQYDALILLLRAEAAWAEENDELARSVLAELRQVALRCDRGVRCDAEVWLHRAGAPAAPHGMPAAPAEEVAGHPEAAARLWDALGCPYDAALALISSGEEAHLRAAVARLDELGARPAVRRARRRMQELGFPRVPRGPRGSTRSHPTGLTRREQDVLNELALGLSNQAIARRLVITPKTVDHHVSSILAKLGATNRRDAAEQARRLGLLVEDGDPAGAT